jgi:hypothetical protein
VTANPFTVDRTKNHTVNITFSLIKYKVTTEIKTIGPAGEVGGSISPAGPKEYESGSTTDKFTATANAGYKLMIFSDNGAAIAGNTKQFTNIQADHNLYAEFRKELKVTPSTNDATVCPVWRSDNTNVSNGTVEIVQYGGDSLSYTPKFNAAYNNTHKFRSVVYKDTGVRPYTIPTTGNFKNMTVNATVKAEATPRVNYNVTIKYYEDRDSGYLIATAPHKTEPLLEGNPTKKTISFTSEFKIGTVTWKVNTAKGDKGIAVDKGDKPTVTGNTLLFGESFDENTEIRVWCKKD